MLGRDGRRLLTRQVADDLDDLDERQLPDGGLDPGEPPIPTLAR